MRILRAIFGWYWYGLLDQPLRFLESVLGLEAQTGWREWAWKGGFTFLALLLGYEVYLRIRMYLRRRNLMKDMMPAAPKDVAHLSSNTEFTEKLEAVRAPEQTIAALKREKKYDRLGVVYASLNRHKEAAKAFKKAGDLKRAATELAKAGKTVAAARLLEKAGDLATSARFYAEKGKHLRAARLYSRLGDIPNAAAAYAKAGKPQEGVQAFLDYFRTTKDPLERQVQAADVCYPMLDNPAVREQIEEADRKALAVAVAQRFDAAQRSDLAAQLFRQNGDPGRAGEIYLRLGKLEDAARCMQEAGRSREATEIGARYYESKGRWNEAGMAYEGAGQFRQAGDCFNKANNAARAAQCFEKAGEFFGAGFALVHTKNWEAAIRMLQRVKEKDRNYNESRALLGRCFYELKDYVRCAAALENHLTGARVNSSNINYFWMLALAYEQLGELDKSRGLLLKIQTVNVEYRDVAQRLSSIESRISMASGPGAQAAFTAAVTAPAAADAPAVMDMVAHQIGRRYELERELGRGGMGVVYLAKDTQLDRPVALKFLGALLDNSEEYRQRFLREAKAAARVSHPNIVSIYDIGTQEGSAFIAMEYVEGPNLGSYVRKKGCLEAREAINIIVQACSALDAVHAAGIVHRDIKPENIVIAKGGLVKLMDFGLAKSENARLTATGVVMGTPAYMAPEQIRGEEADARTDLYSLGLVLYECLTGRTVFTGPDVLGRQEHEVPPPPSTLGEGIPSLLDQIVLKCIAKNPQHRFQSARELAIQLRQVGK